MAVSNNISNNVTYSKLISSAANSLYNKLVSSSQSKGQYRKNSATFEIGGGVWYGSNQNQEYQDNIVTISCTEERTEDYTAPSVAKITQDINAFMSALNIPTGNTLPTNDGLISFIFALNYFLEKAIIKRTISAENSGVKYHLHYQAPAASSYDPLNHNYPTKNTVTEYKIASIYDQLRGTSLLSDNARKTNIVSNASSHTSSSSSSSCSSSSSSSCSSSSSSSSSLFIAYFNLA